MREGLQVGLCFGEHWCISQPSRHIAVEVSRLSCVWGWGHPEGKPPPYSTYSMESKADVTCQQLPRTGVVTSEGPSWAARGPALQKTPVQSLRSRYSPPLGLIKLALIQLELCKLTPVLRLAVVLFHFFFIQTEVILFHPFLSFVFHIF